MNLLERYQSCLFSHIVKDFSKSWLKLEAYLVSCLGNRLVRQVSRHNLRSHV
jgi:hypothetical protein